MKVEGSSDDVQCVASSTLKDDVLEHSYGAKKERRRGIVKKYTYLEAIPSTDKTFHR